MRRGAGEREREREKGRERERERRRYGEKIKRADIARRKSGYRERRTKETRQGEG